MFIQWLSDSDKFFSSNLINSFTLIVCPRHTIGIPLNWFTVLISWSDSVKDSTYLLFLLDTKRLEAWLILVVYGYEILPSMCCIQKIWKGVNPLGECTKIAGFGCLRAWTFTSLEMVQSCEVYNVCYSNTFKVSCEAPTETATWIGKSLNRFGVWSCLCCGCWRNKGWMRSTCHHSYFERLHGEEFTSTNENLNESYLAFSREELEYSPSEI